MAMKDLKTILEECSINDIYFSNRGTSILYKIPIYQRNYAWEREEIRALINDVYDSMTKSVYYIGTLVTYKRDENIYEVIDGQQRLTTIYIILKALGIETIGNHLTYSARKISATTIEKKIRALLTDSIMQRKHSKTLLAKRRLTWKHSKIFS